MRYLIPAAGAALAIATFLGNSGPGQPPNQAKSFMRAKLGHSQKVLEALALEDFDEMAKHSQDMSLLTLDEGWQVIQSPEYRRRSDEFRRTADALTAAAKKKNLDGATLLYLDLTQKCVSCHKYVRSVK